jgi:hypothetical protein
MAESPEDRSLCIVPTCGSELHNPWLPDHRARCRLKAALSYVSAHPQCDLAICGGYPITVHKDFHVTLADRLAMYLERTEPGARDIYRLVDVNGSCDNSVHDVVAVLRALAGSYIRVVYAGQAAHCGRVAPAIEKLGAQAYALGSEEGDTYFGVRDYLATYYSKVDPFWEKLPARRLLLPACEKAALRHDDIYQDWRVRNLQIDAEFIGFYQHYRA